MPTVTILTRHLAALDGVTPRLLNPGDTVDVPADLADTWEKRGIATTGDAPRRRARAHTPKHETA